MSELTTYIISYLGCALIAFTIGFLELLRIRILSWLPFAGVPFSDVDRSQSYAHTNSIILYVLLIGLVLLSGASNLVSSSATELFQWHWTILPLIIVFLALGEFAQSKLKGFMSDDRPEHSRPVVSADDFNQSVEAQLEADFESSDYARQFATYADYKASLKP